jgi:predicted dehydrogenase
MCLEALAAGKHVLCEKPLARTPEECRAIVDAAESSGLVLGTGFNYRFYPSVQKAREIFASGLIGELDHIRSYTGYTAAEHNHPWIHDEAVTGGGALRDNGIHLLDLTRWFLGEVVEVQGLTSNEVWGFKGCEDNGFALLRNSQGRVATVHASWTEWWGYRFRIEIYGTRGCIRLSCFPMITEVASCLKPGAPVRRKRYMFPGVHLMEHLRSYRWIVKRSFVDELKAFVCATRGDRGFLATGLDGCRAVEIAHSINAERHIVHHA